MRSAWDEWSALSDKQKVEVYERADKLTESEVVDIAHEALDDLHGATTICTYPVQEVDVLKRWDPVAYREMVWGYLDDLYQELSVRGRPTMWVECDHLIDVIEEVLDEEEE
jgi:hypothetical protein